MARKSRATTKGAAAAAKLAAAAAAAGTQARSQANDLGDRLAPVLDDARDRLAPVVDDTRERLVDLTGTVATRIDDLATGVSGRLEDLTGSVATRLDDALPDRVTPAAVRERVPSSSKDHPNRFLQALLVLGLGAVAAAITHRVTSGGSAGSEPVWRSAADQPTPAAGESTDAPVGGVGTTGSAETSVDVAGGTPEEMAADATDTPHAVTTPDRPAQKVIID